MRLGKDETGLLNSITWAGRATCTRRKVGCVLVDARGHTLATGYNGRPAGWTHCAEAPCPGADAPSGTGLSGCEAIHAEANALLRCKDTWAIETVYCTSAPCVECVKLLLNTSCRRIVYFQEYPHSAISQDRWLRQRGDGREWIHLPLACWQGGIGDRYDVLAAYVDAMLGTA